MNRLRYLLWLWLAGWLAACTLGTPPPASPDVGAPPATQSAPRGETPPSPAQPAAPGAQVVTYIPSEGIGAIAVRITFPAQPRYADGAGVVVDVAPFLTRTDDFYEDLDAAPLGLIRVAYLWPGKASASTGARSEGTNDYGGPIGTQALRDVIRFAAGLIPDRGGRYLSDLSPFPVLTDNVGLYAFSHPGIAAVNVLALYGDQLPVAYLVGRENPTIDCITAMELGHWDNNQPVINPLYRYPDDYTPTALHLDYSTVRWGADLRYPQQTYVGYPYFDLNGNGRPDQGDFILGRQVPTMEEKRLYSAALTQALVDNGALSLDHWPSDVATPDEAAAAWAFRSSVGRYADLAQQAPNLKVLLVFADHDHVQPVPDKPHIHQAYDGFHHTAGLWVRLNPDQAYLSGLPRLKGLERFQEHPANTEPADWLTVEAWGYPATGGASKLVPQAAVAEMADRTHENRWEDDLDAPLYPVWVQPGTQGMAPPPGGSPPPSSGTQRAAQPSGQGSPPASGTSGPLLVFYAVHVQIGPDYLPYTDASLQQVNPRQVRNITLIIQSLAQVAEKHHLPITWEFPQPMAQALCASPQEDVLGALAAAGHEIGAYAHSESIAAVAQTLSACGHPPVTVGGLLFEAAQAENPQALMAQELSAAAQAGFRYATSDLAPGDTRGNPFAALCHNTLGEGNDMWPQSGNLMFPWYPDYPQQNICVAREDGDILLVDHTSPQWMFHNGSFVSLLTAANFDALREQLDGALAYLDSHPTGRTAVWGFVTHISEYTSKQDATAPPSPDALAALDDFLAYLEALQDAGKVRLVTVNQIPRP